MFFKKKNNIANIIYDESRLNTEKLYQLIKRQNTWEIHNRTSFVVISFVYHFFFYRMIMLSKYEDDYIKIILQQCMNEMVSHITEKIEEKNKIIEICNDIFLDLDAIVKQKDVELQGKYFIATVEGIKPKDVFDAVNTLLINIHFGSILDSGESFLNKIS